MLSTAFKAAVCSKTAELGSFDDFKYNDYAIMQDEYKYEATKKTHQQYYQVSAFGGIPIMTAVSLQEEDGSFKMTPNFGFTAQFPYYPYWRIGY